MTRNAYLAPIAAKLTINGAINLRSTVTNPCPLNPDSIAGGGRIYTGSGKWTTIAAIGIERHLMSLGLAEEVWTGTYWHGAREERHKNMACRITPLGREVAAYIAEHWDDLTFRNPKFDGRKG